MEERVIYLVLSLVLYIISVLKFSYLTNANPTDMSGRSDTSHCIFSHLILSWGLCTLYHLHLPRQRPEYYNILYANVPTLSSVFPYLKFNKKVSLIFKRKMLNLYPKISVSPNRQEIESK